MKNLMSKTLPVVPDELEDVMSLNKIEELKGKEASKNVFESLKSINELIIVDEYSEEAEIINGQFSFQVIGYSLKIIENHTGEHSLYMKKVIELFCLDQFLDLDVYLTNCEGE
jgi:exosome complex RNA-binding protein Rrp42 (RNase PH superfamily)